MKTKIKDALTKLPPQLQFRVVDYENDIRSKKGLESVQNVTDCIYFISIFEKFILCDEVFIELDEYL